MSAPPDPKLADPKPAEPKAANPKPARRRGTRRIVAVPLVLLILWVCGLIWYAEDIPRGVADAATPTDAVVVLTGGSGRLDVGFALLAEGRAKKLFISGVAREVNIDELIRLYGRGTDKGADKNANALRCCIAIGHTAGDTIGNARETAQWMAQEQFSSLRLVTASYHMRRSLLEFRRAMPNATMIPHPVFPQGFRAGEWWRWPGTLNLLISEYTKFLAAVVGQTLGIRGPSGTPGGAPARDGATPAKLDGDGKPGAGAPAASQPATP